MVMKCKLKSMEKLKIQINTDKLVYVLVDVGNPLKVKKLKELHEQNIRQGKKVLELIIIDSTSKESASRA